MINNRRNESNQPSDSADVYIAKLAFIGASIVTLGDGIAMLAAGLALQQLQNPTSQDSQKQFDQSSQVESLQKQIDHLITELRQVKKMIR